jgi:hypothetical protein
MKSCVGTNDNNGATTMGHQDRRDGTQTIKNAGKIRRYDIMPSLLRMSDQQSSPCDAGIANEGGGSVGMCAPDLDHPPYCVRIPHIGLIEVTDAASGMDQTKRRFGGSFVSAIVDPDMPSPGCKGAAHGPSYSSRRSCDQDGRGT